MVEGVGVEEEEEEEVCEEEVAIAEPGDEGVAVCLEASLLAPSSPQPKSLLA